MNKLTFPGFTAEASLGGAKASYQTTEVLDQSDSAVHPAQLLFTDPQFFRLGLFRWPILEPTCVRICLPHWGGHCRWICF